jgi:hypothetical protein
MMKVLSLPSRTFLKERSIKFCIIMTFICIWLLILVIYYSKGHVFMSSLQNSLHQFLISANLITLSLFLTFGIFEVISIKNATSYRISTVRSEFIMICSVVFLQTVAAIALSAGTPSFPCSASGNCGERVFFAVVAWIAPLLFAIHAAEFFFRTRRIAASNPATWSTATYLVDWEETSSAQSLDLEKGEKHKHMIAVTLPAGPKPLMLAEKRVKAAAAKAIYSSNIKKSLRQARTVSTSTTISTNDTVVVFNSIKAPELPPKSATYLEQQPQYVLIVPSEQKYVVPRLGPPPKYFIVVPENIQYTVPRISPAPCPKQWRRARKLANANKGGEDTMLSRLTRIFSA